ncbi:MAG: asparagine--tRNA ligase, partial [Bacteroidota bacterium]
MFNKRIKIKQLLSEEAVEREVTVMGWVRTFRNNQFIALNDGSTNTNLQVVLELGAFEETLLKRINTSASLKVVGMVVPSLGRGQKLEIKAKSVEILGDCDAESYPLQPKKHSLEFLREIAHLRFRTNTFGAVFRVRHSLAFAVHKFYNDLGFVYLHTPIITASDAEGAGEMFHVTTLPIDNPPRNESGEINYKEDFFGRAANLTVSGQLEGELGATAFGEIYTFGPTFRAENSNTARHLAEFWMIEPEMAFYDIHDNMDLAEDMLKYLVGYALEKCKSDLEFLNNMYDKELISRLTSVTEKPFTRLSYTEATDILMQRNEQFEFKVEWGTDLQKEHENFLVEHFGGPVILTDYPKHIKAFYMKQNEDGKTVRAM